MSGVGLQSNSSCGLHSLSEHDGQDGHGPDAGTVADSSQQ